MGNPLQDALKTALNKKRWAGIWRKTILRKKEKKPQTKDHSTGKGKKDVDLAFSGQQLEDGQSFSELMEKGGFKAVTSAKKKIHRRVSPVAVANRGKGKRKVCQPDIQDGTKKTKDQQTKFPPKKLEAKKVKQKPAGKVTARPEPAVRVKPLKKKVAVKTNVIRKEKVTRPAPNPTVIDPDYRLKVKKPILPNENLLHLSKSKRHLLLSNKAVEQIAGRNSNDEREVNIGLDFGTSSVKVVIGDNVLNKAFAVPFYDATGLNSFLLPSRVWKSNEGYSLCEDGIPNRNLKLQLTGEKCNKENFANAAAFLAFVIRHARGWLFTEHRDIYRRTKIAWKLTLGLPAENYDNYLLIKRFKKLAAVAWLISLTDGEYLSETLVSEICDNICKESFAGIHVPPELDSIEFDVVPELSAQIYGFLTSTKFDPKATNIFMIIDVGAGTIDSSIFHVTRGRAKRLSFDFYANFVEFNGVVNLHAHRIRWFRSLPIKENIANDLDKGLDRIGLPTDFLGAIPENINEYFSGLDFIFSSPEKSPDDIFFSQRVKHQVLANTLKKATKYVTSRYVFSGMPVFLCGGGSRMEFYKKLEEQLLNHPNASWFRFKPRKLEVPDILNAPGVIKEDFDRLSVAFGLSFVRVGKCAKKVTPPPPPPSKNTACPGCGSRTICYCR